MEVTPKRRFSHVDWLEEDCLCGTFEFQRTSALIDIPGYHLNVTVCYNSPEHYPETLQAFSSRPLPTAKEVKLVLGFRGEGVKHGVVYPPNMPPCILGHNIDDHKDAMGLLKVYAHYYLANSRWCVVHGAWLEDTDSRLFILGGKGAGKSTLAKHFVTVNSRLVLVAEDMFLYNLDTNSVQPLAHQPSFFPVGKKNQLCIFLDRDPNSSDMHTMPTPPESFVHGWDRSVTVLPAREQACCRQKEVELLKCLKGPYWYNLQGLDHIPDIGEIR